MLVDITSVPLWPLWRSKITRWNCNRQVSSQLLSVLPLFRITSHH